MTYTFYFLHQFFLYTFVIITICTSQCSPEVQNHRNRDIKRDLLDQSVYIIQPGSVRYGARGTFAVSHSREDPNGGW